MQTVEVDRTRHGGHRAGIVGDLAPAETEAEEHHGGGRLEVCVLCHGALFDGRCEAPVASPSVCSLSWATAGGVLKSSVFIACLALNRSGSLIGCALRTAVEVECFLSGPRATEACKSSESLNPKKPFLTSGKVKHLKISGVGFHSGGGVLSLSIEALSLSIEAHTIIVSGPCWPSQNAIRMYFNSSLCKCVYHI